VPVQNPYEDLGRRFNIIGQQLDQMLPTVRSTRTHARKISGDTRVTPDDIRALTELERILVNYGEWVRARAELIPIRPEEPAWSTP
jgi:hypothetical protein